MSNDNLTKQDSFKSFALAHEKLVAKRTSLQQRVFASQSSTLDPNTLPNRICLMLDCSSSMSELVDYTTKSQTKSKIDLLKEAVENFAQRCDFTNTSVAIETFPKRDNIDSLPLSVGTVVLFHAQTLEAKGGTPLRSCVEKAITKVPMTRAVIVSDGEAGDWYKDNGALKPYKEQEIPIDCVHIGDSSSGEALLRKIAHETKGLYIKFTDVSAFAVAFGYLTPGLRGLLTSGEADAAKLGASEVLRETT